MFRAFLILLAAAVNASAASSAEWRVLKHQGRDYVTVENVAGFYRFPEFSYAGHSASLRSSKRRIRALIDKSEIYINGVRFFTHFPIVAVDGSPLISAVDVGKIIEPVLRPSRIEGAGKVETVILDPGHGGTDSGGSSRWGSEKDFTLQVALSAREDLLRAGFKVEMTRMDDTGLALEERVAFANRFSNAVFISIHFNSGSGGSGIESYALTPDGLASTVAGGHHALSDEREPNNGNAQDSQNVALTAAVHASVLSRVQTFDRGVRHSRFKVLRNVKIPATLLEAGFMSDPAEGQRIATLQYRQELGRAIAQGVRSYSAAVSYGSAETSFTVARSNLPPHSRSITEPLAPPPSVAEAMPHEPSVSVTPGG